MSILDGTAARTPDPDDQQEAGRIEAARLKTTHDEEFRVFTEDSYPGVEKSLRSWCYDRGLVEDALHEAYLHGRAQWPKIREYIRPAGWIILVARNKILKEQARRQRHAALTPEHLPQVAQPDPGDAWEAQELLRGWLHQLPPRHAEVFQMSCDGYSNDDIARILGVADVSVRSYKAAARSRLRQLAEADGFARSGRHRRPGGAHGPR
ncbi:RNA polymerase sigma factor [Actinoplanes sp. CA-252034]|uniref:RNA polymerase sigma factor n=1 Tax=Actinoplanes sp. CA-252034 TaxID=3239906 RepID=UPI003D984B64